jgi:hypothetical protein
MKKKKSPLLEIWQENDGSFLLFKDGLLVKEYPNEWTRELSPKDEVFKVPLSNIREGVKMDFLFDEEEFPGVIHIGELERTKEEVTICYYINMKRGAKYDLAYCLSPLVVAAKMCEAAEKIGFSNCMAFEDMSACDIFKKHKPEGTLGEKIFADIKKINLLHKKVEKQIIKRVLSGKTYIRVKNIEYE